MTIRSSLIEVGVEPAYSSSQHQGSDPPQELIRKPGSSNRPQGAALRGLRERRPLRPIGPLVLSFLRLPGIHFDEAILLETDAFVDRVSHLRGS